MGKSSQTHFGHLVMVFGFFIAMFTLILQGIGAPRSIAFGNSEVTSLSNQYRTNAGLSALVTSQTLTQSAQAKADHMVANSYFAHDAPDGTSPWDFFAAQNYSYTTAGENLALSNQSASSVVDGWYNSSGHRANMMSADFTEVGYGIAFVPSFTYQGTLYNDVYLVAAHYALPVAAQQPAPPAANPVTQEQVNETIASASPPEIVDQTVNGGVANEAPTLEQTKELAIAPTGFTPEPPNSIRSGEYTNVQKEPLSIDPPLAVAGIGTGGAFVLVGSTVEIRRLMRHHAFFPKKHAK